jgi:hypothetical protein
VEDEMLGPLDGIMDVDEGWIIVEKKRRKREGL